MRITICAFVLIAVAVAACSKPPPIGSELAGWAKATGYALSDVRDCTTLEDGYFGAASSRCWSAKSTVEQPPAGSRTFPRLEIIVASYATPEQASARIARFHDSPPRLDGPTEKLYPLRAGFRVGANVVVVTTDALQFIGELDCATRAIAAATGGTEVTCWEPSRTS